MKNIVIFEDNKVRRGSRAVLLKRGNKRVLIQFSIFNHETGKDEDTSQWFKVFNPIWAKSSIAKRNNKRKSALYFHEESNEFYCDYRQSDEFIEQIRGHSPEYAGELYGEAKS